MKHILSLLLIASTFSAFAQQVTRKKMEFDYVQYPSISEKGITNFFSTVIIGYQAEIDVMKNQHEQDLAQAEADYQYALANLDKEKVRAEEEYVQAIALHKQQQADADAAYEEDMKKFRKGGFLIGQDEPKRKTIPTPRKRIVSDPQRQIVPEPNYPKTFDVNTLAKQYVTLEGMNDVNNNALQIIVTLKGFEMEEPVMKTSQKSTSNGTVVTHYAEVAYKHPIHVQVVSPSGENLMDEIIGGEASKFTSKPFTSSGAARGSLNNNASKQKLEEDIMTANMKLVNVTLNDNFGFPVLKRKTMIKIFTHKKMDYSEYMTAYENLIVGYKKLNSLETKEAALEKINNAIDAWAKAMEESDPDNKKARIDKKVTKATHLMLAEAYMWAENFEQAEMHLTKLTVLGVAGKEKKNSEELQKLLEIQAAKITNYKEVNE